MTAQELESLQATIAKANAHFLLLEKLKAADDRYGLYVQATRGASGNVVDSDLAKEIFNEGVKAMRARTEMELAALQVTVPPPAHAGE